MMRTATNTARRRVVTWADATGSGTVAAVTFYQATNRWEHIVFQATGWLMSQFLQRNDNGINAKDFLGVLLTLGGFQQCVEEQLVDHLLRQHSGSEYCVERQCRHDRRRPQHRGRTIVVDIVKANSAMHIGRVPSKSNIADGPARGGFNFLMELQSTEVTRVAKLGH